MEEGLYRGGERKNIVVYHYEKCIRSLEQGGTASKKNEKKRGSF